MPALKKTDPITTLNTRLPQSLRTRLDLLLYSEMEGRVPKGAYQDFFCARIEEYLDHRRLNLGIYGLQGTISGPADTLRQLHERLNQDGTIT